MKRTSLGFSLVEILVVISIISILLAIATLSFSKVSNIARQTAAEKEVEQIGVALRVYKEANGQLPPITTGPNSARPGDLCSICGYPGWSPTGPGIWLPSQWTIAVDELHPTYLNKRIEKDPWGNYYAYDDNFDEAAAGYGSIVCSIGPDEVLDTRWTDLALYQSAGDDICIFIYDED